MLLNLNQYRDTLHCKKRKQCAPPNTVSIINKLVTIFANPPHAYRDRDVIWYSPTFWVGPDW